MIPLCHSLGDADCVSGGAGRVQRGGGAGVRRRTRRWSPAGASRRCSASSTGPRRAASCRSRTRSAAASTATTTCCSSTSCRSSARCELPVVHHLLALPGATPRGRRASYSHPQALAQCERFLRTLTGVEIIATYDTAGSAKMVARAGTRGRRGDRLGARRRSLRPERRCASDPGLRRQHHALPRHRPRAVRSPTGGRQDVDRVLAAERAGRAVQGAERVRAARHRPDEARVAADSAAAPGSTCSTSIWPRARRAATARRALAHLGRVRADAAHARHRIASWKTRDGRAGRIRPRWCS